MTELFKIIRNKYNIWATPVSEFNNRGLRRK